MTTTQQSLFSRTPGASSDTRLSTIRRFYFYLVALISSCAAIVALDGLLAALADAWLGGRSALSIDSPGYTRRVIAESAGLLVVSVPIFLVHWELIRRRFASAGERSAAMRKFFLYAASGVSLGWMLVRGNQLLQGVSVLAFGGSVDASSILPASWLHLTLTIVATAALFRYWQRVVRSDGDYGYEIALAATWRRIFFAVTALVGLTMLVIGSAGIFATLIEGAVDPWTPSIPGQWFATQMGSSVSSFLIGAATARWAWLSWQAISQTNYEEENSTVKRVFLYVATLGVAVATLVPVSVILRDLLLWLFRGMNEPWYDLVNAQATPLAFIPASLILWVAFRDYLYARESALENVSSEAETIRRIYYYVVSATGLTLVWLGSVRVVQVGLDQLFESGVIATEDFWQLPLATGLSLLIVGIPVWLLHWRAVQSVARREDEAGAAERSSLPRRIYLYGVAFVGAILILSYLAQVIYRLFLFGMGGVATDNFGSILAEDIARSLIAAILWVIHLKALRDDGALGAEGAPFMGGGGDGRRRDQIERKIDNLEHELIRLRTQLSEVVAEEEAILAQKASLAVEASAEDERPETTEATEPNSRGPEPVASMERSKVDSKAQGSIGSSRKGNVDLFAPSPTTAVLEEPFPDLPPREPSRNAPTFAQSAGQPDVNPVMLEPTPIQPIPPQATPPNEVQQDLPVEPVPVKRPRKPRPQALG